jgi:large subunit ribosomal protein L23
MGLFDKKKEVSKEAPAETKEEVVKKTSDFSVSAEDLNTVLKNPRITEKATMNTENRVYTFDVDPRANKKQIARAVEMIYKVTPVKVHISKIARKTTRNPRTGVMGVKGGGKKAMVYLKKGDSISFV